MTCTEASPGLTWIDLIAIVSPLVIMAFIAWIIARNS